MLNRGTTDSTGAGPFHRFRRKISRACKRSLALPLLFGGGVWAAQPLKLVVIGDSLSAEYDSITGFAGVDDPTEYAAISVPGWESMSWVEVIGRLRTSAVNLGTFRGCYESGRAKD